jgi:hypothetical protein
MANHKKPDNEKVDAVAGCVHKGTKEVLQSEASRQGVSLSSLIGGILDEWVNKHNLWVSMEKE